MQAINAPLIQDREKLVVLKRSCSASIAQMTSTSGENDHYETINKMRVKIDGSVSDQIQRAVLLMARFSYAGIGGIWGHVSAEGSQSQDKFTEEAETYLRDICKLHDTSSNEEAIICYYFKIFVEN